MITVRHIVEQIINDQCPGKLQLEEIMWPFDDTLAVHLVVDPPQEMDIEIREVECKVWVTVMGYQHEYFQDPDEVNNAVNVFDLHKEKDLIQFTEELIRLCEDFVIKMYVDGTKHA